VSIVAALSLAFGIGANTAIFSLVNSLLLRTLPVAAPQQLATISSDTAIRLGFRAGAGWNYAMWDRFRQRARPFAGVFAWSLQRFDLAQGGEMQRADGIYATGDFFTTLGVRALLGRTFTAADDVRGGGSDGAVAVISYGFWQRRFAGAANVIGTPLVVERVPFTIVGVTPPEFVGLEVGRSFDVALPLGTEPLIRGQRSMLDQPRALFLLVMVRLEPAQSLDAANTTLRAMQPEILGVTAKDLPQLPGFLKEPLTLVPAAAGTSGTEPGAFGLRQRYEWPLLTIFVVVGLVLLIACANIANLLLARAAARRHELSVRCALGATRWRLARQLIVESLVLAAAGAAGGLIVAAWASRALVTQLSTPGTPVTLDLSMDWRVMAFTAAVAIATALVFGTVPALRTSGIAPIESLKEHGHTMAAGTRQSVSSGLVVLQVALSLVLVVAAGLFVRTFARLASVPLGFDRDRVLLINVDTARARVDAQNRSLLYHRLVAAVAGAPGVARAAGSLWTPAGGGGAGLIANARGRSVDAERQVVANFVTPGWFATYGIPIRGGRDVEDGDTASARPVVAVNETFARRFFPGRSAIGETLDESLSPMLRNRTIVGVVGDAVYGSLRDAPPPTIYLPLAQSAGVEPPGRTAVTISARSAAGSPAALARGAAAALTGIDRDLAFAFRPLEDQVNASLAQERMVALLAGFFGALALLLAGLGFYGVTAYAVARRRTEIGIRMALGAQPAGVIRLVLSRVAILVGFGIVVGVITSMWASRFVSVLIFGIPPRDPMTLAAAAVVLAAVGASAGWLPAWRASRTDPAQVLRE
jgi:putative ABC transport system permease protein